MIQKHPRGWVVFYTVLAAFNGIAASTEGGPPAWLSGAMAILMGLLALFCLYLVRQGSKSNRNM